MLDIRSDHLIYSEHGRRNQYKFKFDWGDGYGHFNTRLPTGCEKSPRSYKTLQIRMSSGVLSSSLLQTSALRVLWFFSMINLGDESGGNTFIPQKAQTLRADDWSSCKQSWHWSSFKYDGIRGVTINNLTTREGELFKGLEHIEKEAKAVLFFYGFEFIDGELDITGLDFQEKQSIILSGSISPDLKKKVIYRVFEVGGWHKNTEHMINAMQVALQGCEYLKPVEYTKTKAEDIGHAFKDALNAGAEGLMLRCPYTPYIQGPTDGLLKLKPHKEADFVVTDTYEGNGHISGMLGGVVVRGIENGKRIKCRVGSGFDKYGEHGREGLWRIREDLLGCLAEIRYKNVTLKTDKDGYYSLRKPVFAKFKLDRTEI